MTFILPLQPGRVRVMLIRDVDTGAIVDADVFPTADAADAARSALLVGLDGEFRDYPAGGAVGLADVAAMRAILARAGRRDLADIAWNHLLPPDLPVRDRADALRAAGYPFTPRNVASRDPVSAAMASAIAEELAALGPDEELTRLPVPPDSLVAGHDEGTSYCTSIPGGCPEHPDEEEEPPEPVWDPGPEIDDEGGMSEYRHVWPDDPEATR